MFIDFLAGCKIKLAGTPLTREASLGPTLELSRSPRPPCCPSTAEWVSNIVPVIKKNEKLRVCVDFRDLNKATLKDEYPMPIADLLVVEASEHKIISFMDGSARYNQIFVAEEDIRKTAFRYPGAIGLYEWVVMTFGLKSVGATYQSAMNSICHDLIGLLVEIYIDDVVVMSKEVDGHIANLLRVLERTRKFGLKMNPNKCRLDSFWVLLFMRGELKSVKEASKLLRILNLLKIRPRCNP